MRKITAERLKELLDRDTNLLLINALEPDSFEKEHIPGSHNVPNSAGDLVKRVTDLADSRDQPIVMYCSNKECKASAAAGQKLENAGFTNVTHFPDGMAGWKQAGYDVESGKGSPERTGARA